MGRFIYRRLIHGLIVILGVTVIVFVVTRMVGDPVQVMLPLESTPEQRAAFEKKLGLDRPIHIQFVEFMGNMARLDFGESLWQKRPAMEIVFEKLPMTILLTAVGIGFACVMAIPLGIIAALRPGGVVDRVTVFGSLLGLSVPQFWLGLLFIVVFAVQFKILPTSGAGTPSHILLPALTMGLPTLARLAPPVWYDKGTWKHILGTDHLGRDVLSRAIHGARVSLWVGAAVVLLAGGFGVVMGLMAGYLGGRTDAFIMRWIDTQVAFPGLLLALIILAVIGPSLTTVVVVLALNGWMVYGRMTRSAVLSIRQSPYVEAAEVVGCRWPRILFRHILPNLTSPLLTLGILEFARIVLAEAALSFLGLGIQPPATSWGLDVAMGKNYMFMAWWLVTIPGCAIAVTVLAINLVASWLRLISDPQEREKQFARHMAGVMRKKLHAGLEKEKEPEAV